MYASVRDHQKRLAVARLRLATLFARFQGASVSGIKISEFLDLEELCQFADAVERELSKPRRMSASPHHL